MINIAGTRPIDDPAYRYQMPRLQTKIEGRGNGIKTVVVNMSEVAQALHRDSAEITKFFGCELGAQTSWNEATDKSVVNGAHQAADMQSHLSRYIESFVLCPACHLPETQYKMKTDIIYQKCAACGAKEPVDMTHKLTTFIANAYKKAKKEKDKEGDKKSKREKKSKSDSKDDKEAKEKKSKKKSSSDKSKKLRKRSAGDGEEEEETAVEATDDAVAESKDADGDVDDEELAEDMEDLEVDDRSALDAAIDRFRSVITSEPDLSAQKMNEELSMLQTFSALRAADKLLIYIGATFSENAVQANAIHTHKARLAALSLNDSRNLIAAMEWFCGVRFPQMRRWFPALLKHLYDEDLVEEDQFLAWDADDVENEYISPSITPETLAELRAAAAPFITWLKTAEEDGEDEEEEEEEEA